MSDDKRKTEVDRRSVADEGVEIVPGSGKTIEGRSLPQVVSLRLDASLLKELRTTAKEQGVTVSDLLRRGADMVVNAPKTTHVWIRFGSGYGPVVSGPLIAGWEDRFTRSSHEEDVSGAVPGLAATG